MNARIFRLKIIMHRGSRARVKYGKFGRLSFIRILFMYMSKTMSKSINRVHVSAEHCLSKLYGGWNLLFLYT